MTNPIDSKSYYATCALLAECHKRHLDGSLTDDDANLIPELENKVCLLAASVDPDSRQWMIIVAASTCSLRLVETFAESTNIPFSLPPGTYALIIRTGSPELACALMRRGWIERMQVLPLLEMAASTQDPDLQALLEPQASNTLGLLDGLLRVRSLHMADPNFAARILRALIKTFPAQASTKFARSINHGHEYAAAILALAGANVDEPDARWIKPEFNFFLSITSSQHGRLELVQRFGALEEAMANPERTESVFRAWFLSVNAEKLQDATDANH
jgi:hypothetical protein